MSKKVFLPALAAALMSVSTFAAAEEAPRVQHYEAREAASVAQAAANLREANAGLKALFAGSLGDDDMHAAHQLSYTMETALEDIVKELQAVQAVLEEMHLASEKLDQDKVRAHGEEYLQRLEVLLK